MASKTSRPRPVISYRKGALRPGDTERIVKLRKVHNKTIEQICAAGNHYRSTVVRVLKAAGLPTRDAPAKASAGRAAKAAVKVKAARQASTVPAAAGQLGAKLVQVDGVTTHQVARIVFQRKSGWAIGRIRNNLGLTRARIREVLTANGLSAYDAVEPRVRIADRLAARPEVIAYIAECRAADVDDRVMARKLEIKPYVVKMLRDIVGWERPHPTKMTDAEKARQNDRIRELAEDDGLGADEIAATLRLNRRTVEVALKSMGLDGWPTVKPGLFEERLRQAARSGKRFNDHQRARVPAEFELPGLVPIDRTYTTGQSSIA